MHQHLFCLQTLDHFVHNKKNKLGKPEFDFYPEIKQAELEQFIKHQILGIADNKPLDLSDENDLTLYAKCFNLVFRLVIYLKLFEQSPIINYQMIQEDLQWTTLLIDLLGETSCLRSTTSMGVVPPVKSNNHSYKLSFWRESIRLDNQNSSTLDVSFTSTSLV